jgi:hypothetical protein
MPHDPDLDTDDEPDDDLEFHDGDDDDEPGITLDHTSLRVSVDGAEIHAEADDAETCADMFKIGLDAVEKLRRQPN